MNKSAATEKRQEIIAYLEDDDMRLGLHDHWLLLRLPWHWG